MSGSIATGTAPLRIGAVSYLNARPLWFCLAEVLPTARIVIDLPSRLADGLVSGQLDVGLVPAIEYLRQPGLTIVSDACVACEGPVRSVKLYGRVPVQRIRTLALDEGSRTSAALTRLLLKERFGVEPRLEHLPIGAALGESAADAVMLIGDRGMFPPEGPFEFVWDLGEEWTGWTGLPFVFAMWVARPGIGQEGLHAAFAAARDGGVERIAQIARHDAPLLGLPEEDCLSYLRDHLRFHLGQRERCGLEMFLELAGRHGLARSGVKVVFHRESA